MKLKSAVSEITSPSRVQLTKAKPSSATAEIEISWPAWYSPSPARIFANYGDSSMLIINVSGSTSTSSNYSSRVTSWAGIVKL